MATISHDIASTDEVLRPHLYPEDMYTRDGVYFADLPYGQMAKFVTAVDHEESKKEFGAFKAMFKRNPLAPIGWYFKNAVLPGAGLGLEGYVLFSIGNLTPLFDAVWKSCWSSNTVCNQQWVYAVTYLEILGIIVGQLAVGVIGDVLGRRFGLIQDAVIMFVGLLMLTASWGTNLNGWVICYAWSLFFYGIGVGGEYPMTATAAMESATGSGKVSTREDRLHRGRKVTMAFLMQGWGQLFNQAILIILLLITTGGRTDPPYNAKSAQWTFRVSFFIPAIGTLWLVYYRYFKMPLASKALNEAKANSNVTGYNVKSFKMTAVHFWPRLVGTAGAWFCNDVFFYGNKLFQGQFIKVIDPESAATGNVMQGWEWNLVNVVVSLAGYYLASFFIDNKLYGRYWMQLVGFMMCFIMFVIPAYNYTYYTSTAGIKGFQAMYFLSSFFNQFGPNSVTFLVAAECYPTEVRATAHGFSAAWGKLGALLASILYNYLSPIGKFHFVPWFGLLGVFLTIVFMPDTTGLDLKEQERRWGFIKAGRPQDYHGVAVHPRHLSLWERMTGVGKSYDAALDANDRHNDMVAAWEKAQSEKMGEEKSVGMSEADDEYSAELHAYFNRVSSQAKGSTDSGSDSAVNEKSIAM